MISKLAIFLKERSISKMLALWYTLATSLLLLIACFLLYFALIQSLQKQNSQFLGNEVETLRSILQKNPNDMSAIQTKITPHMHTHYYYRILDAQNNILVETPGMSSLLNKDIFPAPKLNRKVRIESAESSHEKPYLLMSAWANPDKILADQRLIQVAVDTDDEQEIIEDYRGNLFFVLIFGMLISCVIGFVVARRSIRPLNNIVKKVEGITTTQLHERLNTHFLPKELRILADTLNGFLTRIEEGFQRLSQFSVDLAHEIRTPINNLMGETELALTRTRTLQEYQTVLESNLEEYARLSSLVDSLLFIARSENPRNQIKFSTIDLAPTLDNLCEYYGVLADEQQITLRNEADGKLNADPILFRQAVSNLLSNALHHTPAGGQITIKSVETAQHIEISVVDTGSGIPAEHVPHILNRFYRIDSARSKKDGGTGLGLAIVNSIMILHNGQVTVKSNINQGTTFTLIFNK